MNEVFMFSVLPNKDKKPLLSIFDGQILLNVEFEIPEERFEDNISFSFAEKCPPEMKQLKSDEISFGLTSAQARTLAQALLTAAEKNDKWLKSR
jgi:hypothetical protein